MRQDKDRGGKFLLGFNPGALLKLANVSGFTKCVSVQSESVAPRQLPDGLLEVTFAGRSDPDPFLIEIETYPGQDAALQLAADITTVELVRGVVPDAILLVLHPKGQATTPREDLRDSRHKTVTRTTRWRVIELWMLNAADLFAMNEVGVIPWVPLTRFPGPPEELVRECRERIDAQAPARDHDALLVVTQIMTNLAFPNNKALLDLLIGDRSMIRIESPLIAEWEALFEQRGEVKGTQDAIITFLETRFGPVPDDLTAAVRAVKEKEGLTDLNRFAVNCPDLEAFRLHLAGGRAASAQNGPA